MSSFVGASLPLTAELVALQIVSLVIQSGMTGSSPQVKVARFQLRMANPLDIAPTTREINPVSLRSMVVPVNAELRPLPVAAPR
jgi:hypothetical protein